MKWNHPHELARRSQSASLLVMGIFVVLTGAFFRLQVLDDDEYSLQARRNRLRPVVVSAPRGLIVDRDGAVLAANVPSYTISIMAASNEALVSMLDSMLQYTSLDPDLVPGVLTRFDRSPGNPIVILRDAPFELVAALEERRPAIPGLIIQTEPKRFYPHGDIVSHLLGYVGEVSEEELLLGARMGALVGRTGLESQYDQRLRGLDGQRLVVVNALGRTIDENTGERLEPSQGDTIWTTVVLDLQEYLAANFPEGERGAAMAMDPRTGEILAMYSAPTFDPNEFIGGVDPVLWNEWLRSEDKPLLNRAVQGIYPPASPFKLAMALMALEKGEMTLESTMPIQCSGGFQYFNRYFRCWKADGHGELTLAEAISHSCDVYFYQLGLRLGLDSLLDLGTEMGFGERTGVDLPGEVTPTFPSSTAYFDELYGPSRWTNAVTLNLSIGQGENAQTLIKMMQFYAMLARDDGLAPIPRFLKEAENSTMAGSRGSPESISGLRGALEMVVESGTAVRSRIANLRIAGKTGTAQNAHGPNHGWFIGFAPTDAPEIVVGAIVEHGEHGSAIAPFVNRVIARYLLGDAEELDRPLRYVLPADSAPGDIAVAPISNDSAGGRSDQR